PGRAEEPKRCVHARCSGVDARESRTDRRGIERDGSSARRGYTRRPPLSACGGDRRRRRPLGRSGALGAQSPDVPVHAASLGAWGAPCGNRGITPCMRIAMKRLGIVLLFAASGLLLRAEPARASSHMDAPLITLDDAANTTDVYAFVSERFGRKYLSTALAVYPHEEPGIGPNKYNFDDDVLYEIRVATGKDLATGRTTISYQFRFQT